MLHGRSSSVTACIDTGHCAVNIDTFIKLSPFKHKNMHGVPDAVCG